MPLTLETVLVFLLLFARFSSFMAFAPFFSLPGIPMWLKFALATVISVLFYPVVEGFMVPLDFSFVFLLIKEVLAGFLMALVSFLVFNVLEMAGSFMDLEMGFALGSYFDPIAGAQVTIMGRIFYVFALLLLMAFNGHHLMIYALADSFQFLPLGGFSVGNDLIVRLIALFVGMVGVALRLAAPVLAVLLVTDVSLGLISRTVPQLNVFMMGFMIKSGLGPLIVILILPLIANIAGNLFTSLGTIIEGIIGGT